MDRDLSPYETEESVPETQLLADTGADLSAATATATTAVEVKDQEFFENPDNLPDEIAMTCVSNVLCQVLKEFPHGGKGNQIYKDGENRTNMIYECWRLWQYDITDKFTIFDKLRQFGELCRKFLVWSQPASTAAVVVDENKGEYHIQKFVNDTSSSSFVENSCEAFVSQLIETTAEGHLAAVRRELVALSASMPDKVKKLVEVTKSFDAVESLAARIKARKLPPTLLELNQVCHQAVEATAGVPIAMSRDCYVKAKATVGAEFATRFSLWEGQIHRMDVSIATMCQRAGSIKEEVATWNFDKANFVKLPKDQPDELVMNAAKAIETSWCNFKNYKDMANQLKFKMFGQAL